MNYDAIEVSLTAGDLAFAPVNTLDALKDHPDFRTLTTRVKEYDVPLPQVPGLRKPEGLSVPQLGEHTQEVLADLVIPQK